MLADPCADPGIFARVVQARLPENSSRTFDFAGGGADPISPSGSAHVTI